MQLTGAWNNEWIQNEHYCILHSTWSYQDIKMDISWREMLSRKTNIGWVSECYIWDIIINVEKRPKFLSSLLLVTSWFSWNFKTTAKYIFIWTSICSTFSIEYNPSFKFYGQSAEYVMFCIISPYSDTAWFGFMHLHLIKFWSAHLKYFPLLDLKDCEQELPRDSRPPPLPCSGVRNSLARHETVVMSYKQRSCFSS